MKRHFQTLLFAVKNTFPGVGEGVICLWKWCEISINLPLRASNLKEIKFKTFPPLIPFLFLFLGRCSPEQAMDSRKEKEGSLSHLTTLSRVKWEGEPPLKIHLYGVTTSPTPTNGRHFQGERVSRPYSPPPLRGWCPYKWISKDNSVTTPHL